MRVPTVFPLLILLLLAAVAPAPAQTERDALVRNALSAAPASIADSATVQDDKGMVLRKGSNGWVCMPDNPAVANNAPMCLDQPWMAFIGALMGKQTPRIERVGIGYMLQGDMPVSNTDPFATGPTADNQWIENSGPHIMMIFPDPAVLTRFPSDHRSGGPWVMWQGTPYAHLMIPTAPRH
jgi:hypothetical protein